MPHKQLDPVKRNQKEYSIIRFKDKIPYDSKLGEVVATYTGLGGVSGVNEPEWTKFVIDFEGGKLAEIKDLSSLTADVNVQHGRIKDIVVSQNPLTGGYRLTFDFQAKENIAEIRADLKQGNDIVTEIWSYQWLK